MRPSVFSTTSAGTESSKQGDEVYYHEIWHWLLWGLPLDIWYKIQCLGYYDSTAGLQGGATRYTKNLVHVPVDLTDTALAVLVRTALQYCNNE